MREKGIAAFTLAEVLVTLGIIGVVAAITLPTLISNLNTLIWDYRADNVRFKMSQGADKMRSLGLIHNYSNTSEYVSELRAQLKTAHVCESSEIRKCWSSSNILAIDGKSTIDVSTIVDSLKLGHPDWNTNAVGLGLADGMNIILSFNPKCEFQDPTMSSTYGYDNEKNKSNFISSALACYSFIFDVNGSNAPNQEGKDVRSYNASLDSCPGVSVGSMCVDIDDSIGKMSWDNSVTYCANKGYRLATVSEVKNAVSTGKLLGDYWTTPMKAVVCHPSTCYTANVVHVYSSGEVTTDWEKGTQMWLHNAYKPLCVK